MPLFRTPATPGRRRRRTSATAALALLAGALISTTGAPASAAGCPTGAVCTWSDLMTAFEADSPVKSVTLGADITSASGDSLLVQPGTEVDLDLAGHDLTVTSPGNANYPAVGVIANTGLVISDSAGTGHLNATGADNGPGIGGVGHQPSGVGTIIVNSGTVTATGGPNGAGIGSGYFYDTENTGPAGTIRINGGTITATGGANGAAGLGGGKGADGGTVAISGGTVTATGGYYEPGAAIGGGVFGDGAAVTISGGDTTLAGPLAVGSATGAFGSLDISAPAVVTLQSTLNIPLGATATNSGHIVVSAGFAASVDGTLTNTGTISGPGTISGNITVNNHVLSLDPMGGSLANMGGTAPDDTRTVYAARMADTGQTLPTPTPADPGANFLGWTTETGVPVTEATDLTALLGDGPTTTTLYAHWDSYDASDWAHLRVAFAQGGDVALASDLTAENGENLRVTPEQPVVFDLAGHSLEIPAPHGFDPSLELTDTNGDHYNGLYRDDQSGVQVVPGAELTINDSDPQHGGVLTTTGGAAGGAGIGGWYRDWTTERGCGGVLRPEPGGPAGTITINGGTINATGNGGGGCGAPGYGAGIGGGHLGDGGTITVNGGVVNATGADHFSGESGVGGAGIGGGASAPSGAITINGGTVHAVGAHDAAGIGSGSGFGSANVTIAGGVVHAETPRWFVSDPGGATDGWNGAAGIGNSITGGGSTGKGAEISITGGQVTASGGNALGQPTKDTLPSRHLQITAPAVVTLDSPQVFHTYLDDQDPADFPHGLMTNSGRIIAHDDVTVRSTFYNTGTITVDGTLTGADQITVNNHALTFDSDGGTAADDLTVYAASVADAGLTLPSPGETRPDPSDSSKTDRFTGWFTDAGDQVTDTTDLTQLLGDGPTGPTTLTAHWVLVPTVTVTDEVIGDLPFTSGYTWGQEWALYYPISYGDVRKLTFTCTDLQGGTCVDSYGNVATPDGNGVATGVAYLDTSSAHSIGSGNAYSVTATSGADPSVATTWDAHYLVYPRQLNVTADDHTRQFGAPDPEFTSTITSFELYDPANPAPAFVNGDDASVMSGELAYSTAATEASHPGDYPIEVHPGTWQSPIGAYGQPNYYFQDQGSEFALPYMDPGTLTITKAETVLSSVYTSRLQVNPILRLTRADDGAGIAGMTIHWPNGASAVTDADGYAKPSGTYLLLPTNWNDFTFDGTEDYLGSSWNNLNR